MEKSISELNAEISTLKAEFRGHKSESDRRHDELFEALKDMRIEIEEKVSYKTFMLLFAILSSILAYMMWQISDIQRTTNVTAQQTSTIKGIMQNLDFKPEN